jgi:hypothetical protein
VCLNHISMRNDFLLSVLKCRKMFVSNLRHVKVHLDSFFHAPETHRDHVSCKFSLIRQKIRQHRDQTQHEVESHWGGLYVGLS